MHKFRFHPVGQVQFVSYAAPFKQPIEIEPSSCSKRKTSLKESLQLNKKSDQSFKKYQHITGSPYLVDSIDESDDILDPPILETSVNRSNPKLAIEAQDSVHDTSKTPTNSTQNKLPPPSKFSVKFPDQDPCIPDLDIVESSSDPSLFSKPGFLDLSHEVVNISKPSPMNDVTFGLLQVVENHCDVSSPDVRKNPIFAPFQETTKNDFLFNSQDENDTSSNYANDDTSQDLDYSSPNLSPQFNSPPLFTSSPIHGNRQEFSFTPSPITNTPTRSTPNQSVTPTVPSSCTPPIPSPGSLTPPIPTPGSSTPPLPPSGSFSQTLPLHSSLTPPLLTLDHW